MQAIPKPSRRKWYFFAGLSVLLLLLLGARLYLNVWLLDYVNRVLHNLGGYEGSAAGITVDLYRGAYRINDLQINKKNGKIPMPFISIQETDFSIQWRALLHGRIVSDVTLTQPIINFAVNESAKQTGAEVDWTKPIKSLMPIDINIVHFRRGKLAYEDFSSNPKINIYIHNMHGEVRNLRNVVDANQPLPSSLYVAGDSIGKGRLSIKGKMNILKEVPDMDILTQLEDVNLPALNNYSDAYANFDFKEGSFSLYSELIIKDNDVSGYIKPIARNIAIIDLHKAPNPIKLAWESIIAAVVDIFTNHSKEQFATKINLQGNLKHINTDTWSAIAGIVHNAFIDALQKGLDTSSQSQLLPEKK